MPYSDIRLDLHITRVINPILQDFRNAYACSIDVRAEKGRNTRRGMFAHPTIQVVMAPELELVGAQSLNLECLGRTSTGVWYRRSSSVGVFVEVMWEGHLVQGVLLHRPFQLSGLDSVAIFFKRNGPLYNTTEQMRPQKKVVKPKAPSLWSRLLDEDLGV